MTRSNEKDLVEAVRQLHGIVQQMLGVYRNDVAQGRAEKMEDLVKAADFIATPINNAYPPAQGTHP